MYEIIYTHSNVFQASSTCDQFGMLSCYAIFLSSLTGATVVEYKCMASLFILINHICIPGFSYFSVVNTCTTELIETHFISNSNTCQKEKKGNNVECTILLKEIFDAAYDKFIVIIMSCWSSHN